MYEYQNPTSRIDFIKFWELEMDNQKLIKSYQHGINVNLTKSKKVPGVNFIL
jgi:hypothetical protein